MSIFVCARCDHYKNNDLIEAFEINDELVCEYCAEEWETFAEEIADVEAWQEENFA